MIFPYLTRLDSLFITFFFSVFADLSVEFGSLTQEGLVPITAVIRKM